MSSLIVIEFDERLSASICNTPSMHAYPACSSSVRCGGFVDLKLEWHRSTMPAPVSS